MDIPESAPIEPVSIKCPKCGSDDTDKMHTEGSMRLPETDWLQCNECEHQWGHQ